MAIFEDSDILPYQLRRGATGRLVRSEFSTTVTINSHGFRGRELALDRGDAMRILAIGDSFTFGFGVEDHEAYPARLQQRLEQLCGPGQVEVINAGFAACYSPATYYLWLKEKGLALDPDLVLVGFFIGNDLDHDFAHHVQWAEVDARGLPTRIRNTHEQNEDGQRVAVQRRWRWRLPVVRHSHLAQGLFQALKSLHQRFSRSPDRSADPRDADGPRRSDAYNKFIYQAEYEQRTRRVVEQTEKLLHGMKELTDAHGIPLIVMIIPAVEQLRPQDYALDARPSMGGYELDKPQRLVRKMLDEAGIPYLDLLEPLRVEDARNPLYFSLDNHWNAGGHHVAAEHLVQSLLAKHAVPCRR